jgi:type IV secretory pathway component VirB8
LTITESAEIAIGNATAQLRELRNKDNPLVLLQQNQNLIRTYEYVTINFIKDDVALLRFRTITRNNDQVALVNYAMTITFTRIKPKTREQIIRNPAGLFITNFNINEELVSK